MVPGIERCFRCMENTFVSIYIYIEWWKDRYRRGGGLLSMIIIGAIVTPLCRLRYGEITCSNNRWFWKRQLIEEGCNLCVERFPSPHSSPSLVKEKESRRKLIIRSPIIHYLRISWLFRWKVERSIFWKSFESRISIQDCEKTRLWKKVMKG